MRRRNKNKRQVKIVIGIAICLLLVMTIGYAAFSTNITLTAKGNIKNLTSAEKLKTTVVTSGDGLYLDLYEENRYIFRGGNPNNYIKFNNELWRIVSIESDNAIKIVKSTTLGAYSYDERTSETSGPRYNDNNTFCKNLNPTDNTYWGCSIWSKVSGTITTGSYTGTVTEDATLNKHLNTTYYNSLNEDAKKNIIDYNFKVGFVGNNSLQIVNNYEKLLTWNGKIALINASDYLKASTHSECKEIKTTCGASSSACSDENYLFNNKNEWFLAPAHGYAGVNYSVYEGGGLCANGPSLEFHVFPTLFLKSDIKFTGEGTEENPYLIK